MRLVDLSASDSAILREAIEKIGHKIRILVVQIHPALFVAESLDYHRAACGRRAEDAVSSVIDMVGDYLREAKAEWPVPKASADLDPVFDSTPDRIIVPSYLTDFFEARETTVSAWS